MCDGLHHKFSCLMVDNMRYETTAMRLCCMPSYFSPFLTQNIQNKTFMSQQRGRGRHATQPHISRLLLSYIANIATITFQHCTLCIFLEHNRSYQLQLSCMVEIKVKVHMHTCYLFSIRPKIFDHQTFSGQFRHTPSSYNHGVGEGGEGGCC